MVTAIRSFLCLLAPLAVYADAGVVSLRPLYTQETAVLNPALVDLWTDKQNKEDWFNVTFRIESGSDKGYRVVYGQEEIAAIHLVQLGGETIADIVFGQQSLFPQLSVHCLARLRVEGSTLRVDGLGGEKLLDQIQRTGSPRYERLSGGDWDENVWVLTASTAELRHFVLDCLKQPDAFVTSIYWRADPKERAAELNQRSWDIVSVRGASPEAYAAALEQAAEAVKLDAGKPDYWSTLGAAQYRVGAFNEALAALARAEQLRKSASPDDLIFRAMSHQQLGQTVEAKAILLGELSKMLGDPGNLGDLQRYCGEQDKRSRLREAEDLIAPKGK